MIKPGLRRSQWWKDILDRLEKIQPQNWLEISYLLHNINYEDQNTLIQMRDRLAQDVKMGNTKQRHNWILLQTGEKNDNLVLLFIVILIV